MRSNLHPRVGDEEVVNFFALSLAGLEDIGWAAFARSGGLVGNVVVTYKAMANGTFATMENGHFGAISPS